MKELWLLALVAVLVIGGVTTHSPWWWYVFVIPACVVVSLVSQRLYNKKS